MRTHASAHKKPVNMVRIIKAPIRAISKALNLYVKGVTNFSNAYNGPLRTTTRLPDNDQPQEGNLVKSISDYALGGKATNIKLSSFKMYMIQQPCHQLQSSALRKGELRSCRLRKIDEDRVSSFREDNITLDQGKFCIKDEYLVISKSRCGELVSVKRNKFM